MVCKPRTEAQKQEITSPQLTQEGTTHEETTSMSSKHKNRSLSSDFSSLPLSEALARKLLATAGCSAVLYNPDICVKNLIMGNSTHRDHINDQQLPIALSQYQRGIDLKQCWTIASHYIRLVASLIGNYFQYSITFLTPVYIYP